MKYNPYIVALTGGIGSGKSTVANFFNNLNINIIDSDIIAHKIIQPNTLAFQTIIKRYGYSILNNKGDIVRSYLRKIIFQNQIERNWLNSLLHPLINIKTQKLKNNVSSSYLIWVVPLLIENELQYQADRILVVDTNEITQLQRVQIRDKLSISQIKTIMKTQTTRQQRLFYANDVIVNNGTIDHVFSQVIKLHKIYLLLSKNKENI
ncbi:MAG: dephospho-CoA kinase [Pantoea sp. Brub]|nr:dephospho-CoA kinase [Pantoea sp. Brub]